MIYMVHRYSGVLALRFRGLSGLYRGVKGFYRASIYRLIQSGGSGCRGVIEVSKRFLYSATGMYAAPESRPEIQKVRLSCRDEKK